MNNINLQIIDVLNKTGKYEFKNKPTGNIISIIISNFDPNDICNDLVQKANSKLIQNPNGTNEELKASAFEEIIQAKNLYLLQILPGYNTMFKDIPKGSKIFILFGDKDTLSKQPKYNYTVEAQNGGTISIVSSAADFTTDVSIILYFN